METIKIRTYQDLPRKFTGIAEWHNGTKYWFKEGKLHREDGPAKEFANGTKEWWLNGRIHREDGPAAEFPDGSKEFWIKGEIFNVFNDDSEFFLKLTELFQILDEVAQTNPIFDFSYNKKIENEILIFSGFCFVSSFQDGFKITGQSTGEIMVDYEPIFRIFTEENLYKLAKEMLEIGIEHLEEKNNLKYSEEEKINNPLLRETLSLKSFLFNS